MMRENNSDRLLTRREVTRFLAERGFPISKSSLNKLSMPSVDPSLGPKAKGVWGNKHLYAPADVIAWAERRLKSLDR